MAEMASIQWFPGHMTKTRRMIQSSLSLVDGVVEVLDARIPFSSRNPEMDKLVKDKPRMCFLTSLIWLMIAPRKNGLIIINQKALLF